MKLLLLMSMVSLTTLCGCVTRPLISSGVTPNEPLVKHTPNGGMSTSFGPEKIDPLEDDPRYRQAFQEADQKTKRKLAGKPHGLGFVHLYWETKKEILRKDYRINWKNPSELNPYTSYD